jgi:hypothetical protein
MTTTLAPLCVSLAAVCSASCIARLMETAVGGRCSQLRPACAAVAAAASVTSATSLRSKAALIA